MERQETYKKYIIPLLKTMEQFLQQADIPYLFAFAPDGLESVESAVVAHTSLPPDGSDGMVFVVTYDVEKQAHTVDIVIMPGDDQQGDPVPHAAIMREISSVVSDSIPGGETLTDAHFGGQAVRFGAADSYVESDVQYGE